MEFLSPAFYKGGPGGPLLGAMTFGNSKNIHKTSVFVYMYKKPPCNLFFLSSVIIGKQKTLKINIFFAVGPY